ncbi:type III endosome membrane protein TEMP [Megalops cyprinoides]|uniref:type III endosome membrane protein TEMP n=1 Tax=Megalops cyprinoides TaxID=118141 RepID=UPI001864AEC1|nr:type III endosome membrane protein TEMP [Megalops cyprinoides]
MGSLGHSLGVMLCFWGTVTGNALQAVDPCVESSREVSCNQRRLTAMLGQMWDKATELDLSQKHLNLTQPKTLRELQRFTRLVMLNLSGNYLPLLERNHLGSLPALQVLDLSRCHLAGIENGALQGFPKLQTLLLGSNRLQDPLPVALRDLKTLSLLDLRDNRLIPDPPDWLKGVGKVFWPGRSDVAALQNKSEGHMQNFSILTKVQRRLLADLEEDPTTAGNISTSANPDHPSHSWPYLVAVLVTAITVSVLIALVAKCKLFCRYLASYQHTRLREGDTVSQCDPMGLEVGFSGQGMTGRGAHATCPGELEDDDGFIEDNYIQASERERAAAELEEEDDDIQFTIG